MIVVLQSSSRGWTYLGVVAPQHRCDSERGEEQMEGGGGAAVVSPQLNKLLQQRSDRRL